VIYSHAALVKCLTHSGVLVELTRHQNGDSRIASLNSGAHSVKKRTDDFRDISFWIPAATTGRINETDV
jgi:hypothetical protein